MNIHDKMITVDMAGKMTSTSMLQFLNEHVNKTVRMDGDRPIKRWEIVTSEATGDNRFYAIENFESGTRKVSFHNDGDREEAERGLYFFMWESYLRGDHADAPNLFNESEREEAQALALERMKNP
jgi:hypothetical protein